MMTNPTHSAPVPPINPVIITRLRELSLAVTEERWSEFSMSIPVRRHRDADLVLADAADWVAQAMQEREELISLCGELLQCLEYLDRAYDVPVPPTLLDRAAERLRGGGNDA